MKKTTSRLIAMVLSLVLILSCLSGLTVSAAGAQFVASVDKTELKRGDEFTLTISLKNNTNVLSGFTALVNIDNTVFESVGKIATPNDVVFDYYYQYGKPENRIKQESMIRANAVADIFSFEEEEGVPMSALNGELFSIKLKVKEDAPAGAHPITFAEGIEIGYMAPGEDKVTYPVSAVNADAVKVVVPLESISIPTAADMNVGESKKLDVTFAPAEAACQVEWKSANTKVATVDAEGNITAVAPGTAKITATAGGKSATCTVTVKAPLTGIALNKTALSLEKGDTETLKVTYTPSNTTDATKVEWKSSNEAVATVSSSGKVTAKGAGDAVITATVGSFTATCNVNVGVKLTGVTLSETKATMGVNDTKQLTVTFKPADTTADKTIVWSSDNEAVATVDKNGLVTTHKTGKVNITAKAGGKELVCAISVEAIITDFTLSQAAADMNKGQTLQLTVSNIIPDDTHESKEVKWTTSNKKVATVDANGLVTAVEGGKATITAQVGSVKKTCEITVVLNLNSISLNKEAVELLKGENETLKVSYNPSNTTDDKTVTWTSSNEAVATVVDGKITAVAEGTATITATVMGDKTAACVVTVKEIHLESIALSKTELDLKVGKTATLTYKLNPEKVTDVIGAANWSSDNEAVATVADGKITAVAAGAAVITVEVNGKTAQCVVAVSDIAIEGFKLTIDGKSFNQSNLKIKPEGTKKIEVAFKPADYTVVPGTVTFTSSDETIATVAADGTITAIADGKATIEVKMGDIVEKITVNVTSAANDNTGDNFMLGLVIALAVLSAAGVAVICVVKSRKNGKF